MGVGETVIIILDPDFVFLKPITQTGSQSADLLPDGLPDNADVVRKGKPVAQAYGLGGQWVQKFDVAAVTGDPQSNALKYTEHTAAKYFAVGPPMMLHIDDATALSKLWSQYMRPVLNKIGKDILADMWAYVPIPTL